MESEFLANQISPISLYYTLNIKQFSLIYVFQLSSERLSPLLFTMSGYGDIR